MTGMAMRRRMLVTLLVLGSVSHGRVHAGELPAQARQEIEHLLSEIQSSKCEFFRNGSWYGAQEAEDHLRRKLDYAVDHGLLTTTEQFIDEIASRSSMSGQEYRIRCGGGIEGSSRQWLLARLSQLRRARAAKPHK